MDSNLPIADDSDAPVDANGHAEHKSHQARGAASRAEMTLTNARFRIPGAIPGLRTRACGS